MNKKRNIIIILSIILVVIFIMYNIDMNRMKNNKPVIFSNWGYSYTTLTPIEPGTEISTDENFVKNLEIDINSKNIKEQKQIYTDGLFDLGDGITTYETDLMQNDMIWQSDVRLYYKIITDEEHYKIYKDRIAEFPESNEINFSKNFVIVIANENNRSTDEIDMIISEVYADTSNVNVIMKQKDEPNMNDKTNVWYVIVDKTQLKDTVKIEIKD